MAYKFIILEKRGKIAWLTFNRPEVMNAISEELILEMREALAAVERDKEVIVLVITGAGRSFMAGADIPALAKMTPYEAHRWNHLIVEAWLDVEKLRQPVIAAINGFALGGGLELALACDIRIASDKAKLGLPEVKLGIIPGAGGTQRLMRVIPKGIAMELLFTGKTIDAQEAYRIGLVNKVAPAEEFIKTVENMANEIASNAPVSLDLIKNAVLIGKDLPLEAAVEYGHKNLVTSITTSDSREGLNSFVEKRSPKWQGK